MATAGRVDDAAGEGGLVARTVPRKGGHGGPSGLVPVFLKADTPAVCARVTVTTADGTPVVVRQVASRTMFTRSEAEFETAWESFGAPDGDADPKPLGGGPGVRTAAGRRCRRHVRAGPAPPRSLALHVRDVEPRGGDARRRRGVRR